MRAITRGRTALTALALAAMVAAGLSTARAADEPENLIKYRQNIMSSFAAHLGAIGAAVKGEVSFTDEIGIHARAINALSKNIRRLFPEGTGPDAGKTRALPVIWEKPDDFVAAAKALDTESAKLAELADGGDMAAIGAQVGALGKNACGACHETYRAKKD